MIPVERILISDEVVQDEFVSSSLPFNKKITSDWFYIFIKDFKDLHCLRLGFYWMETAIFFKKPMVIKSQDMMGESTNDLIFLNLNHKTIYKYISVLLPIIYYRTIHKIIDTNSVS